MCKSKAKRVTLDTSFVLFLALAMSCSPAALFAQTASSFDAIIQQGNAQLKAGNNESALTTGESASKNRPDRWEGYALVGGALMNLKRYEEAADALSKAIDRAPEAKQAALRDLRRQCLLAESGTSPTTTAATATSTISQAEIVLWKSIENSSNPNDFSSYLSQYPGGAFAVLAKRHLAEGEARQQAARQAVEDKRQALDNQHLVMTDAATGIMAVRADLQGEGRFNQIAHNFAEAAGMCARLQIDGRSGWRLPDVAQAQWIASRTRVDNTLVRTAISGDEEATHLIVAPWGAVAERDERSFTAVYCVRDSPK